MEITIHCRSDVRFAFGVSFVWLALYNVIFWEQTIGAMWHPSFGSAAFIASVLLVVWCVQAMLLLIMPSRLIMRAAASVLFVIAALSSYFTQAYGAVMNTDMLRNALQTDALEVAGLVNVNLLLHVLAFGLLPACAGLESFPANCHVAAPASAADLRDLRRLRRLRGERAELLGELCRVLART